jgi:hypothetical protein
LAMEACFGRLRAVDILDAGRYGVEVWEPFSHLLTEGKVGRAVVDRWKRGGRRRGREEGGGRESVREREMERNSSGRAERAVYHQRTLCVCCFVIFTADTPSVSLREIMHKGCAFITSV